MMEGGDQELKIKKVDISLHGQSDDVKTNSNIDGIWSNSMVLIYWQHMQIRRIQKPVAMMANGLTNSIYKDIF